MRQFIDEDALKRALGDPYSTYGEEERDLDYDELIDKMAEEDRIESDDPVFFKVNGEHRTATKSRVKQLNDTLEDWIKDTKPNFDPWDYLEELFGAEKIAEEALKLVNVNAAELAADVVRSDGWTNTVARYDGRSIELKHGAVAARTQ